MTNQEREEFELVAKACGLPLGQEVGEYAFSQQHGCMQRRNANGTSTSLNPKNSNWDAFWLAVKLDMSVDVDKNESSTYAYVGEALRVYAMELWRDNKEAATRLAIWRAAVEYAKGRANEARLPRRLRQLLSQWLCHPLYAGAIRLPPCGR